MCVYLPQSKQMTEALILTAAMQANLLSQQEHRSTGDRSTGAQGRVNREAEGKGKEMHQKVLTNLFFSFYDPPPPHTRDGHNSSTID